MLQLLLAVRNQNFLSRFLIYFSLSDLISLKKLSKEIQSLIDLILDSTDLIKLIIKNRIRNKNFNDINNVVYDYNLIDIISHFIVDINYPILYSYKNKYFTKFNIFWIRKLYNLINKIYHFSKNLICNLDKRDALRLIKDDSDNNSDKEGLFSNLLFTNCKKHHDQVNISKNLIKEDQHSFKVEFFNLTVSEEISVKMISLYFLENRKFIVFDDDIMAKQRENYPKQIQGQYVDKNLTDYIIDPKRVKSLIDREIPFYKFCTENMFQFKVGDLLRFERIFEETDQNCKKIEIRRFNIKENIKWLFGYKTKDNNFSLIFHTEDETLEILIY